VPVQSGALAEAKRKSVVIAPLRRRRGGFGQQAAAEPWVSAESGQKRNPNFTPNSSVVLKGS